MDPGTQAFFIIILWCTVFKCLGASVPLDASKIDFEKVNRDMRKPKIPFEPDLRQKPAQIIQAHEVLRLALRSFLDLKDANLSLYLGEMRKMNESYLDEFGKEIKGYRTIFSLVLKQVDEVENNNYAVSQFDGDKFDLCSISKYLSHQKTFSDRQNIMTKMGDALGSECDPSMPYKRKLYGTPAAPSEKQAPENQYPDRNNTDKTTIEAEPTHNPALNLFDKKSLEKLCNRQSLDVLLRNGKTKEFLYAAASPYSLDIRRRRVFTWRDLSDIPGIGSSWTGEENWRIEPVDQFASNSFRLKSIRDIYGPREYLFASSSDSVYVIRGLPDEDSAVLTLGSSATWQLLAKVADELRGDYCNLEMSDIQGFVLRNEKYAAGYLNADADDIFTITDEPDQRNRRNIRISLHDPSYWDIHPVSWEDGHNGVNKLDVNCKLIFFLTTLIHNIFC